MAFFDIGIIVFDLNGLKQINDTLGHKEGDKYIKEGCLLITKTFRHSPVYRIGGDEFVAFLVGSDYENREKLLKTFDEQMENNMFSGDVNISTGMDEFDPEKDVNHAAVFERADKKMYERKRQFKKHGKHHATAK